jgi:hypothetical protein
MELERELRRGANSATVLLDRPNATTVLFKYMQATGRFAKMYGNLHAFTTGGRRRGEVNERKGSQGATGTKPPPPAYEDTDTPRDSSKEHKRILRHKG